jgi:endonuclease/exonuclease/phosphatase family metal-dependent hydrolase
VERLEERRLLAADPWLGDLAPFDPTLSPGDLNVAEGEFGGGDHASSARHRDVTVMSWNLYLGGDLDPVLAALAGGDPIEIVGAVTGLWQSVLATDFNVRADAIADQIAMAQPSLIGLQEAVVWRTGIPGHPDPAEDVEFDFTDILLEALSERGLSYDVIANTQEFDAELTGFTEPPSPTNPAGVLKDIRLTDHDVILARADLPTSQLKLSNVQEENFQVNLSFPLPGGDTFTVLRGWNSVDVKIRGKEFRMINTHLEIAEFELVQVLQAEELLTTAAVTPLPVIMVGDFNSSAVPGQPFDTATYDILTAAGFRDTWKLTQPAFGYTCCQAADLRNDPSTLSSRIDLVLYRGRLKAVETDIVGEEPGDRTEPLPPELVGLWPSDHAGMVATLRIPSQQFNYHRLQFGFGWGFFARHAQVSDGEAASPEVGALNQRGTGSSDKGPALAPLQLPATRPVVTKAVDRVFADSASEDDDLDLLEALTVLPLRAVSRVGRGH